MQINKSSSNSTSRPIETKTPNPKSNEPLTTDDDEMEIFANETNDYEPPSKKPCKFKGYVHVLESDRAKEKKDQDSELPKKRKRIPKKSLDFDFD